MILINEVKTTSRDSRRRISMRDEERCCGQDELWVLFCGVDTWTEPENCLWEREVRCPELSNPEAGPASRFPIL